MAEWDPSQYALFSDARLRPGQELIARIPVENPRTVVDLGCGNGQLTLSLKARYPNARLLGVDSSEAMLASGEGGIEWISDDIERWAPTFPLDLIFSNAALHWVPDHALLIPRLVSFLNPGGTLAVQVPDNWEQPTHRIPEDLLADGRWPEPARKAFLRRPVARPERYREWLGATADVDIWQTTYHHVLVGEDPVFDWVKGSVLGPVLNALDGSLRHDFEVAVKEAYTSAYPRRADGTTILPFTRLFMVAVR